MSVTVQNLITNLDTYLGDSSNDRISQAERFQALTEATSWVLEELGNEHMVNTYEIDFLDSVNYYKVTSALGDLLTGADLRRAVDDHDKVFTRKSPREIAQEIGAKHKEEAWAIERKDGDAYIVINYEPDDIADSITSFDTITTGGTWTADTSNSDATNITTDTNEFKQGSGSLNFDVDVSQSGNDYAVIYAPDSPTKDLSHLEDLGSYLLKVYIPDADEISSFTLTWGDDDSTDPSSKSNYWSATITSDLNGNSFVNGWNEVKFDWNQATVTGSPDSSDIQYYEIRMSYTGSQVDDTDFRYDDLRIVKPEPLTFHYISWKVGADNSGSDITAYSATTDVPFFSGQYDQYKYPVAHKAASILFYSALRLPDQGAVEESEAVKALERYRKNFESSKVREVKNFKVQGVNLRRGRRIGRIPRIR